MVPHWITTEAEARRSRLDEHKVDIVKVWVDTARREGTA
jgi:hypothetical protein